MTKISPKIYAEILYQLCEESKDLKSDLHKFIKLLAKHNNLSLANEIIKSFNAAYNRKRKSADISIFTAKELSQEMQSQIAKYAQEMKPTKEYIVKTEIRPDLLGGCLITIDDLHIDASMKNSLHLLKNKMINN